LFWKGEADSLTPSAPAPCRARRAASICRRTGNALDIEEAVAAGEDRDARGELAFIQLPAIDPGALAPEFARRFLQPRHRRRAA
jgi:hypothetical protein